MDKDAAIKRIDAEANRALILFDQQTKAVEQGGQEKTPEYYLKKAFAPNTYRGYRSALKDFVVWAGVDYPFPVTATTIMNYLADRAKDLAPTTLAHRVAAISFVHRLLGHDDPTEDAMVSTVLRGIRKDKIETEDWEEDRAAAFTLEQLKAMLSLMGESLHDRRDKAFILMGLFGAFRQSELTNLKVAQLKWVEHGVTVSMGKVKQDQTGSMRRYKAIPVLKNTLYCPVTALRSYLDAAGIEDGPVFRGINRHLSISDRPIGKDTANRILQGWAWKAGLPYAKPPRTKKRSLVLEGNTELPQKQTPEPTYSVHSFRASFVTVLRGLNVSDALIARQTDHRNLATMQVYDRPDSAFDNNPALLLAKVFENEQE